jgi:hypothetical protein
MVSVCCVQVEAAEYTDGYEIHSSNKFYKKKKMVLKLSV